MRTQCTTKGNRDAGSSCSRDRGLHRYLWNFGGGLNTPNHPPLYATVVNHVYRIGANSDPLFSSGYQFYNKQQFVISESLWRLNHISQCTANSLS